MPWAEDFSSMKEANILRTRCVRTCQHLVNVLVTLHFEESILGTIVN